MSDSDVARVHERLDELFKENAQQHADIKRHLATMQAECKPCQALLARHENDLRGANGEGLKTRLALVEAKQKLIGNPAKQAKRAEKTSLGAIAAGVVAVLWHLLSLVFGGGK